jgi:hypothetical protein
MTGQDNIVHWINDILQLKKTDSPCNEINFIIFKTKGVKPRCYPFLSPWVRSFPILLAPTSGNTEISSAFLYKTFFCELS